MAEPGVSKPYSIIDGDTWVEAQPDPKTGCLRLKNLRTGTVRVYS